MTIRQNQHSDPLGRNLVVLLTIRCVAVVGTCAAIYWVFETKDIALPLSRMLPVLISIGVLTGLSFARLAFPCPVTSLEFLAQVLLDVVGLSLLLYVSGGYTNPIVSYYMVPIAVAATALSWAAAWSITLLCIAAYSLLMVYYQPLTVLSPHMHMPHESANLHLFGMWFTFVLSAVLITYFVVKMASMVRESELTLIAHHDKELRDEHLINLATLAAGTAHEIATPLSSMKVILHDMQDASPDDADILLLNQQASICQEALRNLSKAVSQSNDTHIDVVPAREFVRSIIEQWKLLRPATTISANWHESARYEIRAPTSIAHSLMSLLNNAADASPDRIDIDVHIEELQISICIQDYGPGIDPAITEQLGRSVVTTKGGGIGIGLLLTHATINRFGGEVALRRNDRGTVTLITLPTQELKPHE